VSVINQHSRDSAATSITMCGPHLRKRDTPFPDSLAVEPCRRTTSVTETICSVPDTAPCFTQLRDALLDLSEPVSKRTRVIFYLRSRGRLADLQVLLTALRNRHDSERMRHELAYMIGQF